MFQTFTPSKLELTANGEAYTLWGLPVEEDNIAWLLAHEAGEVLAVDAPAAAPVLQHLSSHHLRLTRILLTHRHRDHVAGLDVLCRETGCPEPCFPPDPARLPAFRGQPIRVMDTSGHSPADFSYWLPGLDICFCGDTLFAGGCGRLFAGPPARMWDALRRLRALPDATWMCMGHDYAVDNFRFASRTFPDTPIFQTRLGQALTTRADRRVFAPVRLGDEARGNPMLMADLPDIATALHLDAADPVAVFTQIRENRNLF